MRRGRGLKDNGMFDVKDNDDNIEPVQFSPETLSNLSKHLSKEGIEWVSSTDTASDTDDLTLFTR